MAVFHFVHILPSYLHAPVAGHDGQRAFQILVIDGGGIVQAAYAATLEVELHHARILEVGQSLVSIILETAADVFYVAEKPEHDIDEMAELGEQGASVRFGRTMPSSGQVITFVPIPITV